jgi:hypothetical protein
MESEAGLERFVRGPGIGYGRRLRCVQHRLGNVGFDFLSFHTLRLHRFATDFWIYSAHRRHGPFLEHG